MAKQRVVNVSVEEANILQFESDIAIFKYADRLYGADRAAMDALGDRGLDIELPRKIGQWTLIPTRGVIAPDKLLFVGVGPLYEFQYPEIRKFARTALAAAAEAEPEATMISITLHGPGYGLDEVESFNAEIAGLIDALQAGDAPPQLTSIVMVERDGARVKRLRRLLANILPDGKVVLGPGGRPRALTSERAELVRAAGIEATQKVHVFVAMPFTEEMEDVFEFGIKSPINDRGYLCERADLAVFAGDINQWVKERIATADMVVADLTGANPNVYLEIGYAWGTDRSTVLVAREGTELKFDVRTQRCLFYKNIKDLKAQLTVELEGLERGAARAG